MEEESKRPRRESESKEDRISNLPNCLIQHILSFLPSTKEAIRTSVLSKQWKKQWTGVPVLIMDSNDGTHCKNIFRFYSCKSIKRLYFSAHVTDLDFDEIICFATRRNVEDLTISMTRNVEDLTMFFPGDTRNVLWELFFNNVSLVTLRTNWCDFMPKGKVNWDRLKVLTIFFCKLSNQAVEHILSGSPLLESFELMGSEGFDKLVITSKYLKRLVLEGLHLRVLEISCPNLKHLCIICLRMIDSSLFDPVIKNVVLVSSSLESMELYGCRPINQLVIASESLKILVICIVARFHCLQVSCTKLERLDLSGKLKIDKVEFVNFPSSVLVDLKYLMCTRIRWKKEKYKRWITNILQQLHNVNQVRLEDEIIEVLSGLEVQDLFSPVLRTKRLILNKPPGWKAYETGLACLLYNLPMLETLVISEQNYMKHAGDDIGLIDVQENYWNSTRTVFNCLVSHLKTVEVIDVTVSEKDWELLLNFVDFLLKNARVLERMAITSSWPESFKERLLSSPRLSQHAIIEFREK